MVGQIMAGVLDLAATPIVLGGVTTSPLALMLYVAAATLIAEFVRRVTQGGGHD